MYMLCMYNVLKCKCLYDKKLLDSRVGVSSDI